MRQEIIISVIIPAYAVSKYLPECIESVLNQTYKNIEIILVDDGSPDESSAICDRYSEKHSNIKVVHKMNGGLSDARNNGIKIAMGDYIAFLDGDDLWDDEYALERLVQRINITKADVLNFSYKKYYEDTEEKIPYFDNVPDMPKELKEKAEQLNYITQNHLYIASACNKLVKRNLFTESLLFEKGVYSEDVEWSAKLLCMANSLDFVCANFYCYRQRRDSISHTINDKKCQDLCKHIISCIKIYERNEAAEKETLANYAAYQFGTFILVQAQAENAQNECIRKLKEYQWILTYHKKNRKLMLLNIACKIIGYKNVCKLIRTIYKQKHN